MLWSLFRNWKRALGWYILIAGLIAILPVAIGNEKDVATGITVVVILVAIGLLILWRSPMLPPDPNHVPSPLRTWLGVMLRRVFRSSH
jgi:hypothetical protein